MKQILTSIISGFVAILLMIGIKMLDLPAIVTALLILVVIVLAIFGISGGFGVKKEQNAKHESKSPVKA